MSKICIKCGLDKDDFYEGKNTCKDCYKTQSNEYREKNKKKILKKEKEYRDNHKEYYNEYSRKYRLEHRDYFLEYSKEYRQKYSNYFKNYYIVNSDKYDFLEDLIKDLTL